MQRDGDPPAGSAEDLALAQAMQGRATSRLLKLAAFNTAADDATAAFATSRLDWAKVWGRAWQSHADVLTAGSQQASRENFYEGLVLGVLTGVLAAAAVAAVAPVAAGASLFVVSAEGVMSLGAGAGSWVGVNTAAAVVGTGAGAVAAPVVGRPDVPGPSGGAGDAEAKVWQDLATLQGDARRVATAGPKLGLMLGNAEYCIAQVQAHIDGGTTDADWPTTHSMVDGMSAWDSGLAGFDRVIDGMTTAMTAVGTAAKAATTPDKVELEKQIWTQWMASLTDDEVLDQDVIQKHLVALGLIEDYFYMSDSDQHEEVRRAKARVAAGAAPAQE